MLIWDAEAECYALHPLASVTRLKSTKGKLPPMTLSDPSAVPVKRPTPPPASSSPPVSAKRQRVANGVRASSADSSGRASTPLAEAEETDDFDFAGAPTPQPPKAARLGPATTTAFVPTPNMTPRSPAMSDGGLPARSTSGGKGLALVNMAQQSSPPRPLSDDEDGDDDRDDDYEDIVPDRRLDPAQFNALAFAPVQPSPPPAPVHTGPFGHSSHPPISTGAGNVRQRSPGMHSDEETDESESDEE